MAALIVQSRFAGLKIEDDDSSSNDANRKKAQTVKKADAAKKAKNANNNNSNSKAQSSSKKKKGKPAQVSADQWEQWKQKDEQLVDGNYEDELQQAILLSKLELEQHKLNKKIKKEKEPEVEKKVVDQPQPGPGKKKQKKKNVMSLDQFNDMVSGEDPKTNHEEEKHSRDESKSPDIDRDTEFFERVKDDTRNELLKDKIKDRVRKQRSQPDEVITRVQFADSLERKDQEIAVLKQEIVKLKEELLTVKSRNKKLCNILGQGEMKDKAEVLVEVERLRGVQAELNAELASLHSDLEKERSRNADTRTKDKKKKEKTANGEKEK